MSDAVASSCPSATGPHRGTIWAPRSAPPEPSASPTTPLPALHGLRARASALRSPGITLVLEGDATTTGQGLSGGKMIVFPPREQPWCPRHISSSSRPVRATRVRVLHPLLVRGASPGESTGIPNLRAAFSPLRGVGEHSRVHDVGRVLVMWAAPAGTRGGLRAHRLLLGEPGLPAPVQLGMFYLAPLASRRTRLGEGSLPARR